MKIQPTQQNCEMKGELELNMQEASRNWYSKYRETLSEHPRRGLQLCKFHHQRTFKRFPGSLGACPLVKNGSAFTDMASYGIHTAVFDDVLQPIYFPLQVPRTAVETTDFLLHIKANGTIWDRIIRRPFILKTGAV